MSIKLDDIQYDEYRCPNCGRITEYLTTSQPACVPCSVSSAGIKFAESSYPLTEEDLINWPKHYNAGQIQPIDVIEDWKLDFRLANAVKYIARYQHKGKAREDLEKAVWYINRYIEKELGE